jgi:large subunit ribosomal protein L40e
VTDSQATTVRAEDPMPIDEDGPPADPLSDRLFYEFFHPEPAEVQEFSPNDAGNNDMDIDGASSSSSDHEPPLQRRRITQGHADVFQIFVRTLTGVTLTFVVHPHTTIGEIKEMLRGRLHLIFTTVAGIRLHWGGRMLEDHRTLSDYNITANSTLMMALRLRGGAGAVEHYYVGDGTQPEPHPQFLKKTLFLL